MREFLGSTDKSVGMVLKKYRIQHGYSQQKVANYLGIDRTTYTKYETLRKPDFDVFMKLSAFYNVSLDEMFSEFFAGGEETMAASPADSEITVCLNNDEQELLKYFRKCSNKKEALKKVRDLYLLEK